MKMTNKWKKLLTATGGICAWAITLDEYRMTRIQHKRLSLDKSLEDSMNNLTKTNKDLVSLNKTQQDKVESLLQKLKESQNQRNDLANQYNSLTEELSKAGLHEKNKTLGNIPQSTGEKGKIAEAIFKETKEFKNDIQHNNILGFIEDYVDAYKQFLSTLTLEQLACLTNFIMLCLIFSTINGLIINYYSNLIINRLNLEIRFPKLVKIILLRSKLSHKLVKLQIMYLYVLVLISLSANIYMFF